VVSPGVGITISAEHTVPKQTACLTGKRGLRVSLDHSAVLEYPWLVAAISLGGGGMAAQVAGLAGDLGIVIKLIIFVGTALVIFGSIYFFAPA
jgi:hypothetical protein